MELEDTICKIIIGAHPNLYIKDFGPLCSLTLMSILNYGH
jgi:hypothetical protein